MNVKEGKEMNRINKIEVLIADRLVGRMATTKEGLCAFEYAPEWIETGFSISPFELPLRTGVAIAKPRPFDGNFGVFDDALPDGWGMIVLSRYLQEKGIAVSELGILDCLSLVGSTGRGALEFRPDRSVGDEGQIPDFEKLAFDTQLVLSEKECRDIETLYRKGGSPGGARPKVFVKVDGEEWLVKFKAKEDSGTIGQDEYRYSLLAKKCGIEMPETRLFDQKYFGVKRFDRENGLKLHVASAAGLLRADYRIPSLDYVNVFALCLQLTHCEIDMWKLFRIMVFNYLIGNKDDHAKNFAFIVRNGAWHIAPAFDLLPSYGMNGYHTTSFADSVSPSDKDVLLVARKVGLDLDVAKHILDDMRMLVTSNEQ